MNITNEQQARALDTIERNRRLFTSLSTDDALSPFYHVQADAICWPDELPPDLGHDAMRSVQFLLAARSQSYVDSGLAISDLVEKLRRIVPEWPFLREDRYNGKWQTVLVDLRNEAMEKLDQTLQQRKHATKER